MYIKKIFKNSYVLIKTVQYRFYKRYRYLKIKKIKKIYLNAEYKISSGRI